MLMRNTSAPASNSRAIIVGLPTRPARAWRRSWRGAGVSFGCCLRRRPTAARWRPAAAALRRRVGCSGRSGGCSAVSVSCTVQERCSPVSTSKKPVRSIAARQAILGAADGEFLVARAHEGLARPFAAAVVVDRVDVIDSAPPARRAAASRSCAPRGSTSLRWSSPRCPCSRARRRPGCRCCCRAGNRPAPARRRQQRRAASATRQRCSARNGEGQCGHDASLSIGGFRVIGHGLSTTMARKSFTLVKVGPGRQQIAQARRKIRSNCCRQERRRDRGRAPRARATVSPSTKAPAGSSGCAGAAVGAVGVGGERRDAGSAGERDRQRQRVFLVRAAAALAADGDGQFAAGQDHRALALRAQLARELGMRGRDLARLAFDAGRRARCTRSRRRALPLRAARKRVGRPRGQREAACRRKPDRPASAIRWPDRRARASTASGSIELVLGDDRARVGERGRIGHGRPRADHGRIVARHVGDRERHDARRMRRGAPAARL